MYEREGLPYQRPAPMRVCAWASAAACSSMAEAIHSNARVFLALALKSPTSGHYASSEHQDRHARLRSAGYRVHHVGHYRCVVARRSVLQDLLIQIVLVELQWFRLAQNL